MGSVFLMLQALLGLDINAKNKIVSLNQPHVPKFMNYILIENLMVNENNMMSFKVFKKEKGVEVKNLSSNSSVQIKVSILQTQIDL